MCLVVFKKQQGLIGQAKKQIQNLLVKEAPSEIVNPY